MRYVFLILLCPLLGFAENWPQFRGPNAQGVSPETGFPTTWSETENIKWKASKNLIPAINWLKSTHPSLKKCHIISG